MASGFSHLASGQVLLAIASWVAWLASDERLLDVASDEQTGYGIAIYLTQSPKSHHV